MLKYMPVRKKKAHNGPTNIKYLTKSERGSTEGCTALTAMALWRHLKKNLLSWFSREESINTQGFLDTCITISYEQSSFCTPFLMVLDRGIKGSRGSIQTKETNHCRKQLTVLKLFLFMG